MQRLPRSFYETYEPGAVTLYLDDLEALRALLQESDASSSVPVTIPVTVRAYVDGVSRETLTHEVESFEDLKKHAGDRLTGALEIKSTDRAIELRFHHQAGLRLEAYGTNTETRFRRVSDYLRARRNLVGRLTAPSYFLYMGVCLALAFAPIALWPWRKEGFSLILIVVYGCSLALANAMMLLKAATVMAGPFTRIYLVHRHARREELARRRTDFRHKVVIAVITAILSVIAGAMLQRSCAAREAPSQASPPAARQSETELPAVGGDTYCTDA